MNVLNMLVKDPGAAHRRRIRVHVNKKKYPERYNPGQLMQLSQKKCAANFYSHSFSFYNCFGFKEILRPKRQFYNFRALNFILLVSFNKIK